MTHRSAPDAQAGFSLIEMMAALSVVAIAGLALLNMVQATTRNTGHVQERALAMVAAENLLNTEILRGEDPQRRSGRYALGGAAYDWRLRVEPAGDADLLRLRLEVRLEDEPALLAEIETFRRRRQG
jgi:general secretion pathway protein I